MNEVSQHIMDAMLRTDFPTFVARAMAELEPGTTYTENWHVQLLCDRLERVRVGTERRLMINLPPRSLKSMIASIAYAAWVLGHDPSRRIMCVTYSRDVAKAQAQLFKKLVEAPWFRRVFPHCRAAQHTSLMDWQTRDGGGRLATSIQGSMLGRGADIIIIDDPNKGQEIHSQVARDKVKLAYDQTISTRLNHPKESAIICVMQRLHQDDLAGHMLEQETWHHIVLPAVSEATGTWDIGWGLTHRLRKGDLLQPDRMGLPELQLKQRQMGMTMYQAQYQQQPIPPDGIVIRDAWLRYYDSAPSDGFVARYASWDTASSLSEDADYSVGTVWGVGSDGYIYLLDVVRGRWQAPDLTRKIVDTHNRHKAHQTIIEDSDIGRAILQTLRRTEAIGVPIIYKVRIDKLARMEARASMFETGKVLLRADAAWLPAYKQELLGFPNARHDDQVDSTSQALDIIQQRHQALLWPEAYVERNRRPVRTARVRRQALF